MPFDRNTLDKWHLHLLSLDCEVYLFTAKSGFSIVAREP